MSKEDQIITNLLNDFCTISKGGCLSIAEYCEIDDEFERWDKLLATKVKYKLFEHKVVEKCQSQLSSEWKVKINKKGIDIYYNGGWDKYLLEFEKDKEKTDKEEQITKKWAIRDAKGSYIGGIYIGIISLIFNMFQYFDSNNKDKKIETLQNEVDSIKKVNNSIILLDTLSKSPQLEIQKQTIDTLKHTTN